MVVFHDTAVVEDLAAVLAASTERRLQVIHCDSAPGGDGTDLGQRK